MHPRSRNVFEKMSMKGGGEGKKGGSGDYGTQFAAAHRGQSSATHYAALRYALRTEPAHSM
jgi:hypothetical protein